MEKFAKVLDVLAGLKAQAQARLDRIHAAYAETNSGLDVTIDRNGRAHAPCDGYLLPDGYADFCNCDPGKLYGKGEFLPIPLSSDEMFFGRLEKDFSKFTYKTKVKGLLCDIEDIKSLNIYGIEVSHGRSWDESGALVAYAYITGTKTLADAAAECLAASLTSKAKTTPTDFVYLDGRQTVTGEIVSIKVKNDDLYGPSLKMMVITEAGAKLWGTLPKSIPTESVGRKIEFTGTFKPGKEGLSYFSRPSNAELI